VPRPIQPGGPTILIGGSGEKKTLRLVARYADACNLFAVGTGEVQHKLEVLEGHCTTEGRDPAAISKTIIWGGVAGVDDVDVFLSSVAEYAALGVDQVWVSAQSDDPAAWVAGFAAHAVPRLAEMG